MSITADKQIPAPVLDLNDPALQKLMKPPTP
jgi:hypothetical protein